jgi:predicted O-linked N-acetylglucosamine transferase (SPINDLY family)
MDYRLTDPHMNPPGEPSDGPEELLRLPHCYWAYRPAGDVPEVGPPPAERNGFVTFGSFNNYWKVNPGVVAVWAQILKAVPDARLLVIVHEGENNVYVRGLFDAQGIEAGRVRLLPQQGLDEYFRLFGEVDIALDSFPYNGGITSLNALWMGLPVVTLAGARAVSRAGLSVLSNLGLTDLVAHNPEEYVRIAAALAADRPRLAEWRGSLRDWLRHSPLMDERRFTRDLEALYRQIWERWRTAEGVGEPVDQ